MFSELHVLLVSPDKVAGRDLANAEAVENIIRTRHRQIAKTFNFTIPGRRELNVYVEVVTSCL